MDGLQLVLVVFLSITAVCTVGQEDNSIDAKIKTRDVNNITVQCVQRDGGETPVGNPTWYLNGATIGENPCLNSRKLNGNLLSFTITPDCEGYLQCSSGSRCSSPQRVYGKSTLPSFSLFLFVIGEASLNCIKNAQCTIKDGCCIKSCVFSLSSIAYPTLSTVGSTERMAMPGSDVVLPCYLTVSAFNNFEVCWFFTRNGNRRMEISCTSGSDYSLKLPMVNSSRIGRYQCKATATSQNGLPNSPSLTELGPNIMLSIFGKRHKIQ